jgi:hypothetical protein
MDMKHWHRLQCWHGMQHWYGMQHWLGMQHWHEHATWTWTFYMDMACSMDMDMQHGHGHTARIWSFLYIMYFGLQKAKPPPCPLLLTSKEDRYIRRILLILTCILVLHVRDTIRYTLLYYERRFTSYVIYRHISVWHFSMCSLIAVDYSIYISYFSIHSEVGNCLWNLCRY